MLTQQCSGKSCCAVQLLLFQILIVYAALKESIVLYDYI